ncbi:MAG: 4Fe-4S dicluster domain-containing protein [Armatimonadetes bacterium]|nr:4Fe-4S dicluster domain-containing protein [Armatimonadota bacterium]
MAERRVVLHYPRSLIDQPVVSGLVKQFDLTVNIMRANITPEQEGVMVVALSGEAEKIDAGLRWVEETGIRVQPLERDVTRDDRLCTHCGHCVIVCPVGALRYETDGYSRVLFDPDRCIACELCVPACPPRAMKVRF